jgi:transposase-like protein
MGQRGRYKYICEECNAENWLSKKDRNSRFRPKCIECGSTWLEPSHGSKGSDKIADAQAAAKEQIALQNKKMGKE